MLDNFSIRIFAPKIIQNSRTHIWNRVDCPIFFRMPNFISFCGVSHSLLCIYSSRFSHMYNTTEKCSYHQHRILSYKNVTSSLQKLKNPQKVTKCETMRRRVTDICTEFENHCKKSLFTTFASEASYYLNFHAKSHQIEFWRKIQMRPFLLVFKHCVQK